jgi:flagellar biogenesis protein FliO
MAGGDSGFLQYESGIDLGSMLLTLARYAFVTFAVLLIFWALMHLLRRSLERTTGLRGHGRIRVLESARLYGDKLVHIVRVDDKEVLIGSSRDGISYLGPLETRGAEVQASTHLESPNAESGPAAAQRSPAILGAIAPLARGVFYRLRGWALAAVDRAKSVFRQMRLRRPPAQRDDVPEEALILREGARRVNESTQEFRKILSEEVSASADDSDSGDCSSKLERLRLLAARPERCDEID